MSESMVVNAATAARVPDVAQACSPWWRHPWMWLVVGGPAVVVVAAIATGWIAMHGADPVVSADAYRPGLASGSAREAQRALVPAHQGRNHATTPTADLPKLP